MLLKSSKTSVEHGRSDISSVKKQPENKAPAKPREEKPAHKEAPKAKPAPVKEEAPKTEFELEIEALIQERKEAKKAKNFARADEIRNYLKEKGVTLTDTAQGTTYTIE